MARDTLPAGTSLLALAGSSLSRESVPESPSPADTGDAIARRRIGSKRQRPVLPRGGEVTQEPLAQPGPLPKRKQKVNARISSTLLDAVRDCVVALSGPPHGLTMDGFAEEAYRREIERLKRAHHDGEPFPRRPYNPKPGARVG